MAQCKVWLDNYQTGQYYPGSLIQGRVILNFNSETKCRAVKLIIFGREHTEWMGTEEYTEPGSNERKSRDVRLEGNNDFFSTELLLYGTQTGTTTLSAGQHIYPFNFTLPNQIPGTYNCEYGSISFRIKAIVDRPMAFDYTDELILNVISLVDLNNLNKPELLEISSYSDDKTLCCLCCAQGPITMDVSLPKKTLVPGEIVNITARVSNLSNTNLNGLELKLKQYITCKVDMQPNSKSVDNTLVHLNEVGLGAHGEHTYTFPVQLPPTCVIPNFSLCKLFKVNYRYEVIAELPGVHTNLEIYMYPEVGNIEIGHQTPIGGYQSPSVITYPVSQPTNPGFYPAPQYPQAEMGYPPYPQTDGAPAPNFQPFAPPPSTIYPPSGAYGSGSQPPTNPLGYPSKAQEAAGYPTAPPANREELPPSYNSINNPK